MLNIKKTNFHGEYLVSLITNIGSDDECRMSYKCDQAHIKHFFREVLRELSVAEILKILADY